jgi:hypothetical protein
MDFNAIDGILQQINVMNFEGDENLDLELVMADNMEVA